MDVIAQYVDEKGNPFQLLGSLAALEKWVTYHVDMPDDDDEEGIRAHVILRESDMHPTAEQRQDDKNNFAKLLQMDNDKWQVILQQLSRKKNGTLSKGRVHSVFVSQTFAYWVEDSYGWRTPEVRIKSLSDDTAELQYEDFMQKY